MPPKLPPQAHGRRGDNQNARPPPPLTDTYSYRLPKNVKTEVSAQMIETLQRVSKVEIKYEHHKQTYHFKGSHAQVCIPALNLWICAYSVKVKRAKALFFANIRQDNPTYERLNNSRPAAVKAVNSVV